MRSLEQHEQGSRTASTSLRSSASTGVQAGTDGLRAMVADVRRRGLAHDEARAVADLLSAIRRLLPDEDLDAPDAEY